MDKLSIYNMALDLCGQAPILELHEDASEKDQTEKSLDLWYPAAYRKASHEMPWPFLEVRLGFEKEDGSDSASDAKDYGESHGYKHSYKFSEEPEQMTWAEGDRFQRFGGMLCTDSDKEPEAWGIKKEVPGSDTEGMPEGFLDLVAISLAYLASVRLSPDQTTRNAIYYLYNDRRDELINHYLQAERIGPGDSYAE